MIVRDCKAGAEKNLELAHNLAIVEGRRGRRGKQHPC